MLFTGSCVILLTLLVRDSVCDDDDIVDLTDPQKQELLDIHNELRRRETNASNMRLLSWNCDLEDFARQVVGQCIYRHSNKEARTDKFGFSFLGENLVRHYHFRENHKFNITTMIETQWYSNPKTQYTYANKPSCKTKGACDYYVQTIWADTYMMGCALTDCPTDPAPNFKSQVFYACVYVPAANMTQPPYKQGAPCSGCNKNEKDSNWAGECVKGLCNKQPVELLLPLPTCECLYPKLAGCNEKEEDEDEGRGMAVQNQCYGTTVFLIFCLARIF